ncbi:hypothetical protein E2C01_101882 [Portunus trituberculatus]|uniref:Uncharacterized protein n=1 Tax=Portunus trituberculatus TaxID=210409 RepID=A0A5B7KMZ1_PORTR|nr:hypothetical protein [Portunus trituberculatus]
MALSPAPAAAEALAAAPAPPPFSGPATPSAINMLSRRISCGSGGSSSCVFRSDKTAMEKEHWVRLGYIRFGLVRQGKRR